MPDIVCNYATIRFLPYREVGEFVLVGVIVHCPQLDYFDYKMVTTKRTGRVGHFFPELDIEVYKASVKGFEEFLRNEKKHHSRSVNQMVSEQLVLSSIGRFLSIVRKREGLLHFGETGTLLTSDPAGALDELYRRYIERQFAKNVLYQETVMKDRLTEFLREWNIARFYETDNIGDDDFHVKVPFVHKRDSVVTKIVKPLHLAKNESSDVYQHGDTWISNVRRLKRRGHLPKDVIFTVSFPQSGKPLHAAISIKQELENIGMQIIDFEDTVAIRTSMQV